MKVLISDYYSMIIDAKNPYDFEELKPTEAQELTDRGFLERIQEEFIVPLVSELSEKVSGFEDLDWQDREIWTIATNVPSFGKGDCLPFGPGIVYAGFNLGSTEPHEFDAVDTETGEEVKMTVEVYRPRFGEGSQAYYSISEDGESAISDIEGFLKNERDEYDRLPAAYKAALLYQYVNAKVLARPSDIRRFIMGEFLRSEDAMETLRFLAAPSLGVNNIYAGWSVRFRDARPTTEAMRQAASYIREYGNLLTGSDSGPYGVFEEGSDGRRRRQRKQDSRVELACAFAYDYEQAHGTIDKRKGGIGYEKLLIDMQLEHGDKVPTYSDPDSFRRTYNNWKKRNGLS